MIHFSVHILLAFATLQSPADAAQQKTESAKNRGGETSQSAESKANAAPAPGPGRPVNYLGIRPSAVQPFMAAQLQDVLPKNTGLVVATVSKGSPADEAGIRRHDIIVSVDKTTISTSAELRKAVTQTKPGQTVKFTIIRSAKKQTLDVKLRPRVVGGILRRPPTPKARRTPQLPPEMLKTGPAAGPRPSSIGKPKHFCSVELIQLDADQFKVTVKRQTLEMPKIETRTFTGSVEEVSEHFKKAEPEVRQNISVSFSSMKNGPARKASVKVMPRVEGKFRFARFVSTRWNKDDQQIAYVYDKRLRPDGPAGHLLANDRNVQTQLKKLPAPIRKRIDQTIRSLKDFVSPSGK